MGISNHLLMQVPCSSLVTHRVCPISSYTLLHAVRSRPKVVQVSASGVCSSYSPATVRSRVVPVVCHARSDDSKDSNQDSDQDLDEYIEAKVDGVHVKKDISVVFLRLLDGSDLVLPIHVGEAESTALEKEINKQRSVRPITHDLFKNVLYNIGWRCTKVRITDIVANTYYARMHLTRINGHGPSTDKDEVDVDARPSDAINMAVRFGAPVYVNKRIALVNATKLPVPAIMSAAATTESQAEIIRSVKETLNSFEDPTIMFQLQKELAIQEQRYEDARAAQQLIYHEMTHNVLLRLIVAMETALSDQRYEEAARLRDEYKQLVLEKASEPQQNSR